MYILFQLCLLLLVSIVLTSFISNKRVAVFISGLLGLVFSAEVASVLLGGGFIDYKFFVHLNGDIWKFVVFFAYQVIGVLVSLILSAFLIYYSSRKWKIVPGEKVRLNIFAVPVCLVFMSLEGGIINNLFRVANLSFTEDKEFYEALKDLTIKPSDYVLPENIKAKPGKNIIVISIESLEKGFLSDQLAHLTPNLRKMAKEMSFFEMRPAPGSDWTAGSIYTEVTGFPAFFKSETNKIFQTTYGSKITGLGHILNSAGYNVTYMLAGAEFGGVGDMLKAHQFKIKTGPDFSKKYPSTKEWGIHDKDLFEEAKSDLLKAKQSNKPFALFMSTISTHFPDGIYDPRMEGIIPKQRSKLEFMVAATDYMIGDLYNFLKEENMLENTSIFLFPDHILMGQTSKVLSDFSDPRSLYLITNAPEDKLTYSTNEKIFQIDIPKIILEGAEVKHNAKFLTDFIKKDEKLRFIQQNQSNILALNEASLDIITYKDGIDLELKNIENKSELYVKSSNHIDTIKNIKGKDVFCELLFDQHMRIISKRILPSLSDFNQKYGHVKLLINVKDTNVFAYLNKGQILGIAKNGNKELSFSKADIDVFSLWNFDSNQLLSSQQYISPYKSELIYLTSTAHDPMGKFNRSEIRIGSSNFKVSRGVNLLTNDSGVYKVENFDTYGFADEAKALVNRLKALKASKEFYALLVHDSGEKELLKYREELKDLGFTTLATLGFREAYMGYSYKGFISEYKSGTSLSFCFPQEMKKSIRSDYQIEKDARDVNKFIAHAGGEIEGFLYTNSLEALELSYKKGFRLFELDINRTSDGKFVAVHDWNAWKRETKYSAHVPVSSSEFLKHKFKGRFTPLDMDRINKWFKEHPDAILVTDKVNEPKAFASKFIDKSRLMMELFSIEAVKEGVSAGIKSAMPSSSVINQIQGDRIAFLKDLNVKHICVSRKMIEGDPNFYVQLAKNNIKTYVFHINFEMGKDEVYAVLYDMDYIYGIYADDWSFGM